MAASFGAKTVKLPSDKAAVKPSLATAAASAEHPFALSSVKKVKKISKKADEKKAQKTNEKKQPKKKEKTSSSKRNERT